MKMKFNTKKMQYFYSKYKAAINRGDFSIENIYKNPSDKKIKVWQHILRIYNDLGGRDLAIISHSIYYFSAAFKFRENNKEFFLVVTPFSQYISEINED